MGAETKEKEPTILFTPGTKFLPSMGGRKVKKVAHDGIPFRTGWQARTRASSSQAYKCDAPENGGSQREAGVVIYYVNDWGERFHL